MRKLPRTAPPLHDDSGTSFGMERLRTDLCDGYLALLASLQASKVAAPRRPSWAEYPFPERNLKRGEEMAADPFRARAIKHAYVSGAVLAMADEVTKFEHRDTSPQFELIRHLRNAIAHGNHFKLTDESLECLDKKPAFLLHSDGTETHRIRPRIQGKECLGAFIGVDQVFSAFAAACWRAEEIEMAW